MAINSIRDNTVQNGGATNPAGYDSSTAQVKMSRLTETAYIERFRDVTDFNVLDQAPVTLIKGQESPFKISVFLNRQKPKLTEHLPLQIQVEVARQLTLPKNFRLTLFHA